MEFSFGAPKPLQDPEAQLFATCLSMAAEGGSTEFPLNVVEKIAIPLPSEDGKRPQLATFTLDFESFIHVRPEGKKLAIHYTTFEGSDASSEASHAFKVWSDGSFHMEVGKQRPHDMPLPEYLRRTARDWATARIESEIAQIRSGGGSLSAWNIQQTVDMSAISFLVGDEFNSLSINVDAAGHPTLGRMRAQPFLRLGPDPIMGVNHHLRLDYADKLGNSWQERLTAFPIGDYAAADEIRSELVRRHCGEYDSEFGYDWTDAKLVGQHGLKDRDDRLMAFATTRFRFDEVLEDFGNAFAATFSNVGGEWKPIQEALLGGDLDKTLEAIRDIAEIRPSEYQAFLAASDWTLPFDPLELYELRLRQHRDLDLNAIQAAEPTPTAPKL